MHMYLKIENIFLNKKIMKNKKEITDKLKELEDRDHWNAEYWYYVWWSNAISELKDFLGM